MFSIFVEVDGAVRKFDMTTAAAKDLNKPLRQFGGYLRKKAAAKYKAQDFAPLAASTIKRRAAAGLRSAGRKFEKDVRGAFARARKANPTKRGLLASILMSRETKRALDDLANAGNKGVRNRSAVLAMFQGQHGLHGTSRLEMAADAKPLSVKQLAGVNSRTDRAVAKAVGAPILGKLGSSLKIAVANATVMLQSRTRGNWSEVHNLGGVAGHGAQEPKRETIKIEPSDLDVLGVILEEHLILPLKTAG